MLNAAFERTLRLALEKSIHSIHARIIIYIHTHTNYIYTHKHKDTYSNTNPHIYIHTQFTHFERAVVVVVVDANRG